MKYLIGLIGLMLTLLLLMIINNVFELTVSEFLFGWGSCMGYNAAEKIYENYKLKVQY